MDCLEPFFKLPTICEARFEPETEDNEKEAKAIHEAQNVPNEDFDIEYTVWKIQDFSITQISRKINFGEIRSAKTAVFAIFGL